MYSKRITRQKYTNFEIETKDYLERLRLGGRILARNDAYDINEFIKGVKALNLWQKMICWPLRSSQNYGTGTLVESLGGIGIFRGSMINGPTWGLNGINFVRSSTQYITTNFTNPGNEKTLFSSFNQIDSLDFDSEITFSSGSVSMSTNNTSPQHGLTIPQFLASPVNINTPFNTNHFFAASHNQSSVTISLNGGNELTGSFGTTIPTITGNLSIGIHNLTNFGSPYNGRISFVACTNQAISSASIVDFYNLYKNTLGKGLDLP